MQLYGYIYSYGILNRSSDCDLLIPDDKSISRKHALIRVQANEKVLVKIFG